MTNDEIASLRAQLAELTAAVNAWTAPKPAPEPAKVVQATELERDLAAQITAKVKSTTPEAALGLARSLVRKGHVYRDTTGALAFSEQGRAALPMIAPLPTGDDDHAKASRAYQREQALRAMGHGDGAQYTLPEPEPDDDRPRAADGTYASSPLPGDHATDADKIASAMSREHALRKHFGDL